MRQASPQRLTDTEHEGHDTEAEEEVAAANVDLSMVVDQTVEEIPSAALIAALLWPNHVAWSGGGSQRMVLLEGSSSCHHT